MLTNCPMCERDGLMFLGVLGKVDCYRCRFCNAECIEPTRETFAQWADKRLATRLAEKQRKRKGGN